MMSNFVNHTFNDETKIDKIVTCISFDNPDLILFTETHLLSDPKNPKHPLPAIKKLYKHFALGCCASNSGGIAILSKNPIIVHYTHKSGNLIHFSVVDDMNNSIPFIHCYASPSRRQYYYRLWGKLPGKGRELAAKGTSSDYFGCSSSLNPPFCYTLYQIKL